MKTIKMYINDIYFNAEELECLALNLSGLIMLEDDFKDLINQNNPYYSIRDDMINDLRVNLQDEMIGFDCSIVEQVVCKIEAMSILELQRLYTALYSAGELLKMLEWNNINSK